MILENFRKLVRAYVPSAKKTVIPDVLLDLLINKGVDDVNQEGACYVGDQTFSVVADVSTYLMSVAISDFVEFASAGLWWNDGTAASPDWKRLDSITRQTLDDQHPQWKNEGSESPLRCVLESDNLLIDPTPDTSLTDGFWAFFIKKATYMTNSAHYPFTGSTTEIGSLTKLDDAIIDYVRWKLSEPLGSDRKGIISEQKYKETRSEKILLLKRRLDISGYPNLRMRGTTIQ